jgi:hypothetical protein
MSKFLDLTGILFSPLVSCFYHIRPASPDVRPYDYQWSLRLGLLMRLKAMNLTIQVRTTRLLRLPFISSAVLAINEV